MTFPFRFVSKTFDFSLDAIIFVSKLSVLAGAVILVKEYVLPSDQFERLFKFFKKEQLMEDTNEEYYGPIFERMQRFKDNIDRFDYSKLVSESNAWLKSWNKLKEIVAVPVGILTYLFSKRTKQTNDDTGTFMDKVVHGKFDNSKLSDSVKQEVRRINKDEDHSFDLNNDDLKFLEEWPDEGE